LPLGADLWDELGITVDKNDSVQWIDVARPVPSPAKRFKMEANIPGLGPWQGEAQVVLMGTGFTAGFPFWDSEYHSWFTDAEGIATVPAHSEDFMILKVDLGQRASAITCMPSSTAELEAGERVWAVGFPEAATRVNGLGADGESRYVTTGRVHASYHETPSLQADLAAGRIDATIIDTYDRMLLPSSRFLHSADAWIGMSGGMILNSRGEIVGTVARGWETDTAYVDVSSDAVRTSYVRRVASDRLGALADERVFACAP
jgi:hypothetical protein